MHFSRRAWTWKLTDALHSQIQRAISKAQQQTVSSIPVDHWPRECMQEPVPTETFSISACLQHITNKTRRAMFRLACAYNMYVLNSFQVQYNQVESAQKCLWKTRIIIDQEGNPHEERLWGDPTTTEKRKAADSASPYAANSFSSLFNLRLILAYLAKSSYMATTKHNNWRQEIFKAKEDWILRAGEPSGRITWLLYGWFKIYSRASNPCVALPDCFMTSIDQWTYVMTSRVHK